MLAPVWAGTQWKLDLYALPLPSSMDFVENASEDGIDRSAAGVTSDLSAASLSLKRATDGLVSHVRTKVDLRVGGC
jgi:hypothetical protein